MNEELQKSITRANEMADRLGSTSSQTGEELRLFMSTTTDLFGSLGTAMLGVIEYFYSALRPVMRALSAWWEHSYLPFARAQHRLARRQRKASRHQFLMHGKHGLKRPKGRRKVPG